MWLWSKISNENLINLFQKCFVDHQYANYLEILEVLQEGRKANHKNFSSEPNSPNFLVRATSESSSYDHYSVLKFPILQDNIVFSLSGHVRALNMNRQKYYNDFIMLESSNHENDVKLYLGKT